MNVIKQDFFVIRGTESSFNYSFPISTSLTPYTHIVVSSLSIPKTFYTLPEDSIVSFSEDGNPAVNVIFSKGNYTSQSFLSIFNSKVALAGLLFNYELTYPDISLEPDTGKYTLNVSGNLLTQEVEITVTNEYLAGMLGLEQNETYTVSSWLESDKVISFQVYDKLYIKSNIVENSAGLLQDIVTSSNPYFSSITFNNPDPLSNAKLIRTSAFSNNNFNFTLLNSLNKPINLNGATWSFVVKLFRIDPVFQKVREYIEVMSLREQKKLI